MVLKRFHKFGYLLVGINRAAHVVQQEAIRFVMFGIATASMHGDDDYAQGVQFSQGWGNRPGECRTQ